MIPRQLVKMAGKDEDYNVIPPKAGENTIVDETGYELVEIAHPQQIQVALSLLNDGVVENGVEVQKAMIDIARKNPRGVLAELLKTLTKVANFFDAEMTPTSLKIAAEIDAHILKLADGWADLAAPGLSNVLEQEDKIQTEQEHNSFHSAQLDNTLAKTIDALQKLDWDTFGISSDKNKRGKEMINWTIKHLVQFQSELQEITGPNVFKLIQQLVSFVKAANEPTKVAINMSSDWGNDPSNALEAWSALKDLSDATYQGEQLANTKHDSASIVPAITSNQGPPAHGFLFKNDDVKKLQQMLGFTNNQIDGKFGPKTYAAAANKKWFGGEYNEWTPEIVKRIVETPPVPEKRDDKASIMPTPNANVVAPTTSIIPKSDLLTPYDPNDKDEAAISKRVEQDKDTRTFNVLSRLGVYPDLAVFDGKIYPYGTKPQIGQKRAINYLNTPQWVNYLTRGGISGRKSPWEGGGMAGKQKD